MKNKVIIPIVLFVAIAAITAYYFWFPSTSVTPPDVAASTTPSSSGSSSSSSTSIEYSGLPILTAHPTYPTKGYTYINSTDKMVYSFLGGSEWIRIGNTYDGAIDEYSTANFDMGASMGGVAQLRDWTDYLLQKVAANPAIEILDGVHYESTQGAVDIRIPYDEILQWGSLYRMPVYKVINSGLSLRIFLGQSTTPIFNDQQVVPGALLIPRQDNNVWSYVKV